MPHNDKQYQEPKHVNVDDELFVEVLALNVYEDYCGVVDQQSKHGQTVNAE